MSIQYFLLMLVIASLNLKVAMMGGNQALINQRVNEAQAVVSNALAFVKTYSVGGAATVGTEIPTPIPSPSPQPQVFITQSWPSPTPMANRQFGSYSYSLSGENVFYPGGSINITFRVFDTSGNPLPNQTMQIGQRICNCPETNPSYPLFNTDSNGEVKIVIYAQDNYRNFVQVIIGDKLANGWSSVYIDDMIRIPTIQ